MNRRGFTMLWLVLLLSLVGTAAWLTTNRAAIDAQSRRADEVPVQAFALARSALDAGVTGRSRVDTALGPATVDASRDTVVVELRGARATVTAAPWTERFEAPPNLRHPTDPSDGSGRW